MYKVRPSVAVHFSFRISSHLTLPPRSRDTWIRSTHPRINSAPFRPPARLQASIMVKKELFKTEIDYDSFDELADEIVKSPKKAKKASKLDDTPSPDSKLKRARAGGK